MNSTPLGRSPSPSRRRPRSHGWRPRLRGRGRCGAPAPAPRTRPSIAGGGGAFLKRGVRVFTYASISKYVYEYLSTHVSMHLYIYVYIQMHAYICTYTSMNIHVCVCTAVCISISPTHIEIHLISFVSLISLCGEIASLFFEGSKTASRVTDLYKPAMCSPIRANAGSDKKNLLPYGWLS